MMKAVGIIPARLGSTRLPAKVLREIDGAPMIYHVWNRASKAKSLKDLIVATDDKRVADCVAGFGGRAVMTRADHPNGSSRAAEAAGKLDADIVVNIQGDEPMIDPRNIDRVVQGFDEDPAVDVVTLAVRRTDAEGYANPNVVKVVCGASGRALYFSRSPLPYYREPGSSAGYLKHLGIYGYRKDFLLKFVTWQAGRLEDFEKLEQLRILEQGHSILVLETQYDSLSVDTESDLAAVESKLKTVTG